MKERKIAMPDKSNEKVSLKVLLPLLSLLPLLISGVIISVVLIRQSRNLLETFAYKSIFSETVSKGFVYEDTMSKDESVLKSFVATNEIMNFLKDPDDLQMQQKAQEYTERFAGEMEGWDGIYVSDWNSKILTHLNKDAVGMVVREGDSLKQLQDAMLSAKNGIYNVGILKSPASGILSTSMYIPVFDDDNTPIGYVGGGTHIDYIMDKMSDLSSLDIQSAYVYLVTGDGTIAYHPNKDKIGQPVENEVVKGLVAQIQAGEHPESEMISYEYNGIEKYASYFVTADNSAILVITADRDDVLSNINNMGYMALFMCAVLIVGFGVLSILLALKVARPIIEISDRCEDFALGNLNVDFKDKVRINELNRLFYSMDLLKSKVTEVVEEIQNLTGNLMNDSSELRHTVDTSVHSITQVTNAINDVASGNTDLASNVSEQMISVQELGTNIDESNSDIMVMQNITVETVELSNQAHRLMDELIEITNQTKLNVDSISEQSIKNVSAAEEINSITEAISDITSQTNLLSLNASIEAARAGEAGRGFAVVADEIRQLADNSSQQTSNIKEIIQRLANTIEDTNAISKDLVESANTQLDKLDTTKNMFEKVIEQVNTIGSNTDSVSVNMRNITSIKDSVTDIAERLSSVSEEASASSEEVAASAHVINDEINGLTSVVANLEETASELKRAVSYFKKEEF